MTDLSDKIYNACLFNYRLTLRKFKMIQSTPKENYYLFLPLTKSETITAWKTGIEKYESEQTSLD